MSLEELQEEIERLYVNMENELLINIANKLAIGKPMEIDKFDTEKGVPIIGSDGVNEWQLERLKELNGLNQQNAKIISKYSGKTVEEVNVVFNKAKKIGAEVDKEILSLGIKAGILNEVNPITEEKQVKKILKNAINEALTTFNEQNISLLSSAGKNYKQIVNNVSAQVLSGTKTTTKAMQDAISELSQKGLTGFTAKNGAQWSPEAYTKMVIRSNIQNTINNIQEERIKLSGADYVEISQHMGARPLCSEDQGKIYSLSGNTDDIEDILGNKIKVYSWSNSSFGKPDGILGINCGHSRHLFVPGLSIHRNKPINKKENDDAYTEKQQQRLYERTIRNKKREIAMLKEIGAENSYITNKTRQLSSYRSQYANFLKETGRTRISVNEWIGTTKSISLLNESIDDIDVPTFIKKNSIKQEALELFPNKYKNICNNVSVIKSDKKFSYYQVNCKKIYLSNQADKYDLIHEYAHHIETKLDIYNDKEFLGIVKNKFSKYNKDDFTKYKGNSGNVFYMLKDFSPFVSQYQTRVYKIWNSFTIKGNPKVYLCREYFSEGLKYYYKDKELLRIKDKELFNYIKKMMEE